MAREQFQSLTEQMYYILLALLEPRCGVDISQKAMEISRAGHLIHAAGKV